MASTTQRFLDTTDVLYVLLDQIPNFRTLLRLALVNRRFFSICAARLYNHFRIAATSIINLDTLSRLKRNPRLQYVRSLDIDVGARPGGDGIVAFQLAMTPKDLATLEYFERKLPQLAEGISELLPGMPHLSKFRWFGEDVPLKVVETLRESCPQLQHLSWLLRRTHFGPALFSSSDSQAPPAAVPTGPPLAGLRDLACLPNLTSFTLQGGASGLEDWATVLLVLGEKSPRLVHLSLSREPHDCYTLAPLSMQDLSNKYREAGGKPFSIRRLHLRDGFQFLPFLARGHEAASAQQQHPAPYLEQLTNPSLLESMSIYVQSAERQPRAHGVPNPSFPVAWDILNPTSLPRLRSLWISSIDTEAYNYLHSCVDANWLATVDLRIENSNLPMHSLIIDPMVQLFVGDEDAGPAFRRARSLILPFLMKRDMATVECYGAVVHLSTRLPQVGGTTDEALRSFFKLRCLESIHLVLDGRRKARLPPEAPKFARELVVACPKLRYIRIDTYHMPQGYCFRAWAVQHREGGAVLRNLGTLEELALRPSVYDEVIADLETLLGYTLGWYIHQPPG